MIFDLLFCTNRKRAKCFSASKHVENYVKTLEKDRGFLGYLDLVKHQERFSEKPIYISEKGLHVNVL